MSDDIQNDDLDPRLQRLMKECRFLPECIFFDKNRCANPDAELFGDFCSKHCAENVVNDG